MLAGIHSLLQATFKTVVVVSDETSLLETIAMVHPDLVIADLSLLGPREGADVNLASRLKRQHPDLRLVILSIYDDPMVAAKVRTAGAAGSC